VLDPCCVVVSVRLAKVLFVSCLGERLFRHDLSIGWFGAHPGVMQVVALLQEFAHIISVEGELPGVSSVRCNVMQLC
jgi:hypothetical protein